jgi:hypothetical protein
VRAQAQHRACGNLRGSIGAHDEFVVLRQRQHFTNDRQRVCGLADPPSGGTGRVKAQHG